METKPAPTQRIGFGVFEVDLRAGELRRQGLKVKLAGQPLEVLAMLLEHPGEVVSRDELQKRLWSDSTFVDFEHGLNKAINRIRQALDDNADNPRFIETLPRHGYRFIAPVGGSVGVPREPASQEPQSRRADLRYVAAALVLVLSAAVRLWVVGPSSKSGTLLINAVPFTSFPGKEMEPSFSPDGNQIAFAWDGEKEDNWNIYTKLIGAEKPLRLTAGPEIDLHPAWSPDGRYIAFIRHSESEDGIFVVPALGGPVRKVRALSLGSQWPVATVDWSPDGKYLVFCDDPRGQGGSRICWLSLENPGDEHSLTSPSEGIGDGGPRFSPDGRNVAFIRSSRTNDIYLVSMPGGEPRRLTFNESVDCYLTWTSDGAYLIFPSNRLDGRERLWKIRASGGEPEALAAGQEGAFEPAISRDGRRLAYTHPLWDSNIWRFDVTGTRGRSTLPTELVASTELEWGPQISRDGKRIVFSSNRTGSWEIWACDSDGSNPVQVTSYRGPSMTGTPRWSPDGREIAFDLDSAWGHSDIYVVNAGAGRPRRLTTGTSNNLVPSWSNDSRWIYFASDRAGNFQLWKIPAAGGQDMQVTKNGGFAAFESPDGKALYYAKGPDAPGIWEVPVEGGEERLVLEQLSEGYWGYWGLVENGIYFYDGKTTMVKRNEGAIEFFDFRTRQVTKIATPQKPPIDGAPGFAVSPDGRWLLFAQWDQSSAVIMLVENFRL